MDDVRIVQHDPYIVALIDWPEAIIIVTLLVILGSLAGYLVRGKSQWKRIRVGFFMERNGDEEEE